MALEISSEITDTKAIIRIEGEVDVSNASELRDALDTALADGAKEVEADFAEVAYIDSTGIGVLVGAAHRAQESGSVLVVASPQKNVERVFTLLGVDKDLNVRK
jgi:anti-anti-sigma factor